MDTTLNELAKQLHSIADQLLQVATTEQKPLDTTDTKELAGGGGSPAHWSSDLEKGEENA